MRERASIRDRARDAPGQSTHGRLLPPGARPRYARRARRAEARRHPDQPLGDPSPPALLGRSRAVRPRALRARERPRFAYLPFSGGPRLCIGNEFALMEAQLAVAMTAQRYRLALPPGTRVEPESRLTLRPRGGMTMSSRRREATGHRSPPGWAGAERQVRGLLDDVHGIVRVRLTGWTSCWIGCSGRMGRRRVALRLLRAWWEATMACIPTHAAPSDRERPTTLIYYLSISAAMPPRSSSVRISTLDIGQAPKPSECP